MRRIYRWISYVRRPQQWSLKDRSLYFRFIFVFALPRFCVVPKYLSRRIAKHFYHAVWRNILRRMFEKKEVVCSARNYGPMG
jgi:hypothetical protein